MKKIILIILVGISFNSYAVKWVEVHHNDISIGHFVDFDSVKKKHEFIFYSTLENIATMGLNSVIKNNKVDCSEEKVIELNVFYFDQPMGKGVSFEEENLSKEAVYPDQNTAMYKIMKFVCDDGKFFSKK